MKISAFLGSPRPGGNTDILAGRVIEGALSVGFETDLVALRKLRIAGCVGCGKCWSKGSPCVVMDDMQTLYDTIGSADVLLFATPVYWYAPTALMKAFIDRLVPLNQPEGRPLVQGKGAILVTAWEEEGVAAVEPMLRMFELSFDYLGLTFLDKIAVDGVGPKGAVLQKPDALTQAYEVGQSLGKLIK